MIHKSAVRLTISETIVRYVDVDVYQSKVNFQRNLLSRASLLLGAESVACLIVLGAESVFAIPTV